MRSSASVLRRPSRSKRSIVEAYRYSTSVISIRSWIAASVVSALTSVVACVMSRVLCVVAICRGSVDLRPDALELGEVVERCLAEIAAVAGLLDAAVGHRRVDHLVGVDPDGPDSERAAGAIGDVHVV